MEPKTQRASAAFAAIFAGVFATSGAAAQAEPEAPAAVVESAPAAAAPAAEAQPAPANTQIAPAASAQVAPAVSVQAAPTGAQIAPGANAQIAAGGGAQAAAGAQVAAVPPPPPPAWAHAQPAPVAKPRDEYDGPPLVFGRRTAVGGYGGVSAAYTRMFNTDGALLGFEGALHIAHRLSLGVAGYGFSRTPDGPESWDGTPRKYGAGYGGFVGRYAFFTSSPIYPSLGVLIGGGAVVLHPDWENDYDDDHDESTQGVGFFVVQPELSLHANVARWMRLGLTLGYRATSGVSRLGLTESDLNGVVLGGNVQFGWI